MPQKYRIPLFQERLLDWYLAEARKLPWRRTKAPYKIWVSEIMLQQTQVDTVIPYYKRWIKRFPEIKTLAKAPVEDVLQVWAGLGYYRRARMLHEAAKLIVKNFGGKLPQTPEELTKLPGIGRYTAGAIASIAFGRRAPVLDGNVKRVLSRIFAFKEPVDTPAGEKELWAIAHKLVPRSLSSSDTTSLPRKRESMDPRLKHSGVTKGNNKTKPHPGDFNQAMMELGATVCFPLNPRCEMCPVSGLCLARKEGKQTLYPVKSKREKLQMIERFALVLKDEAGRVLLRKQPEKDRWGGLWMFPHWDRREQMLTEFGLKESGTRKLAVIRHGFTKYQVSLNVYECLYEKQPLPITAAEPGPESEWVSVKKLGRYALPSPHLKIAKQLLQNHEYG